MKNQHRNGKLTFKIFVVMSLFLSLHVSAQTQVTKFFPMTTGLMKINQWVAPVAPGTVTTSTQFVYGELVSVVTVDWSASVAADQYRLELLDNLVSQWYVVYDGPLHSFSISDLPLGNRSFRVIACGSGLCGSPSAVVTALVESNPDSDNDGVTEALDVCQNSLIGEPVDSNGCTVEQLEDHDGDGVANHLDICSNTANGQSVNAQGCSPDQIDTDGDGTADYLDPYPHQSSTQCTA